MSTISIHKAENEVLTAKVDNVDTKYTVGKLAVKQFKRFETNNVLFVPAFDEHKVFMGWAEISPSPKTVQDLSEMGFDLFESALSASVIKIQQQIRSKTSGKQMIDKALVELTKQFALGTITAEELRERVNALQGNSIVQI